VAPLPGCGTGRVEFAPLDLSSLKSVRAFAADFNKRKQRLDVLVCNAGVHGGGCTSACLVCRAALDAQWQAAGGAADR
jgi:NAD(P)-dependent dehydrogenase (short-subunit alcohol dehydrogenase family)